MTKPSILLVEYNPTELRLLAGELKGADFDVRAASLPEAVTQRTASGIDLLVTHLHFHDDTGNRDYRAAADLCQRVRAWTRPDLPILALSSRAVDAEFSGFLTRHGFPPDVQGLDIDFSSPDRVVLKVREMLDACLAAGR